MSMNTDATPPTSPQPRKRRKRPNAFADHVREWESLLSAVADHAPDLVPVEAHRAALAASLERAREAKALQESHRANQQSATQVLQGIVAEAKILAIRLRGAVRAELGPTTERLTQFGIRPLRGRSPHYRPQDGNL